MNALERLAHAVASAANDVAPVRIQGTVTEVTPTYCRAAGLSRFVALGDSVALGSGETAIAEVIRIDDGAATVKPFDGRVSIGLGTPVTRLGSFAVAPHVSWRGRVVNALGAPIDGAGPLAAGGRAVPGRAPPPPG